MESSARRRLESISRHLVPHPRALLPPPLLRPNSVGAPESKPRADSPVIIGGMVLDIHAKPSAHPNPGTTTPGQVQYVNGGVARNIAECMSKLGSKPFIISVIGKDMAGHSLLRDWRHGGLCTEGILQLHGTSTPVVSNIFDCGGELVAAVASVEAVEEFLTPGWIENFRMKIRAAPMLMVDANLHHRSLRAACEIAAESKVPVWFEPVSVIKSTRIASVVNCITCTSPNENELVAMANALSPPEKFNSVTLDGFGDTSQHVQYLFQTLKSAMLFLLQKGIKLLLVTLGSNGVFLCYREGLSFKKTDLHRTATGFLSANEMLSPACSSTASYSKIHAFHFPALPASVVSLTGAGDCLVGGVITAICAGLDVVQSVAVGVSVAKAAVESEANVPSKFSLANIADEANKVLLAAKPLSLE